MQKKTEQNIINMIQEKIKNTNEIVNLQVDIKDEIDFDKVLSTQQKRELHNLRNEKIENLRRNLEMSRLQREIENESFVGNLIDDNHHDKMIQLNNSLNDDQKNILQDLRKQRLILLINKNYDSLLVEIQQTKDTERLQVDGYYVNRINEVREEYLNDDRSREQLDRARHSRLDSLYSETENQTYDLLLDLIHNSENINDISFDSEISQDIQTLNQTLLTENRNVILLENIRRQNYNDELYDILKTAIEEEKNIEKLKNTWSEAIDKLEQEYLTNDRNKLILQQLLNKRIEELQKPIEVPKQLPSKRPQAKRPIEEVENNYPTTNPDKAEPNRNLAGSAEKQILDIISQYRKTLSSEDLRKYFSRTKIKPVTDIITNIYNTSRDKRSLLDVLYYKWVLGKDDSFLFEKRYK